MGEEATCLIGGLRSRTPTRLRAELFHTAGCLFDEGGNGTGIGDVDCVTARHVGHGGAGPFRHELLCTTIIASSVIGSEFCNTFPGSGHSATARVYEYTPEI